MDESVKAIPASEDAKQVALDIQDLDLISTPVIDQNNKLLGQITVDDVVSANLRRSIRVICFHVFEAGL